MRLKVKKILQHLTTVLRARFRFSFGFCFRFIAVVHLLMSPYHIQTFDKPKFKEICLYLHSHWGFAFVLHANTLYFRCIFQNLCMCICVCTFMWTESEKP